MTASLIFAWLALVYYVTSWVEIIRSARATRRRLRREHLLPPRTPRRRPSPLHLRRPAPRSQPSPMLRGKPTSRL